MSADVSALFLFQGIFAIVQGLLYATGFLLLKSATSLMHMMLIASFVSFALITGTFATYFLQGTDRALQMMSPGTELFYVVGAPMIISSILHAFVLMSAAYALFVLPNQKVENLNQ